VRLNIKEMELKKKKTREKEEILLALQGFRILRSLILCWGHHQNVLSLSRFTLMPILDQ
jgi:hypothetical protein